MSQDVLTERSTWSTTMELVWCAHCSMPWAIPVDFIKRRRTDGRDFYCPSGHSNVYRATSVDKLKAKVEALERDAAWQRQARQRAEREALTAKQQKGKAVAKLKRTMTRVHAGVCPECRRHFVNLERHMHTKHAGADIDMNGGQTK